MPSVKSLPMFISSATNSLAEVHALFQELVGYFADVVDFGHGHHRIPSQVGVDDDGLRVGVADHAQSGVA